LFVFNGWLESESLSLRQQALSYSLYLSYVVISPHCRAIATNFGTRESLLQPECRLSNGLFSDRTPEGRFFAIQLNTLSAHYDVVRGVLPDHVELVLGEYF
jgi:hypothetical protein